MVTLVFFEEVEQHGTNHVEDDLEKVWDVTDLHHSSEHGPTALEPVQYLCESFSLPVQTRVVEAQHWSKDAIEALADYLRLEPLLKKQKMRALLLLKILGTSWPLLTRRRWPNSSKTYMIRSRIFQKPKSLLLLLRLWSPS